MKINTIKQEFKENEVKGKIVRKAQFAKQLLADGFKIIDIKPDRTDPDHKRSVFIFEDTDEFQDAFAKILDESQTVRLSDEMQKEIDARVEAAVAAKLKELQEKE